MALILIPRAHRGGAFERIHRTLFGCWVSVLLSLGCYQDRLSPDGDIPPSFVIFLTDDQGWTGTSVQMDPGNPSSKSDFYRTPRLARFATESMRFSSAYASGPNCSPSRISLLTGKSPAGLHFTDIPRQRALRRRSLENNALLPPIYRTDIHSSELTIPELLKQADKRYAAAHFGKWHIGGGGPGAHGFDDHDGDTSNRDGNSPELTGPKDLQGITERAIHFMDEQVSAGSPFYLQISHYAVHLAADSYPETRDRVATRVPGEDHADIDYAAMTEDLDTSFGQVLDEIQRLGIADRTFVFYMSDNGATLQDDVTTNEPLALGKTTLFEGGIRVPLFVRGPGIAQGSSSPEPVIGWDLLPTLLELVGHEDLSEHTEGGSFASLLKGEAQASVERPSESLVWHFPHYRAVFGTRPHSAIRVGDKKLITFYETGEVRLFDLSVDLGETNDLSAQYPEETASLKNRLDHYLERVRAQLPIANPNAGVPAEGDSRETTHSRRKGRRGSKGSTPSEK